MNSLVCDRCGASLERTYGISGIAGSYGPECVRIVARENGIAYDVKKFGVGAFDVDAMAQAMELQRREHVHGRWQWVYSYEERKAHKRIVGTAGWAIAEGVMSKSAMRLNGDEAFRCYEVAMKAKELYLTG